MHEADRKTGFRQLRYLDQGRFHSLGYQVREILTADGDSVLEVGIGPGLLAAILRQLGVRVATVDTSARLEPDVVGALPRLPLAPGAVDTAVSFQTLEHLPLEQLEPSLRELARVARRRVVVSVPNVRPTVRMVLRWCWRALRRGRPWEALGMVRRYHRGSEDSHHHWEIGRRAEADDVIRAGRAAGLEWVRSYRPPQNVYHHFFVFRKTDQGGDHA